MTNTRLLAALLLLTMSGTGAAQRVYKSIDADGNVSYSASPPAEVEAQFIERNRSDRRVSRGARVGSGPDSGRAAGQLPANRSSR